MGRGETIGSLRVYFLVVAVLGGLSNAFALAVSPLSLLSLAYGASLVLALAFLYVGIRLRYLVENAPRQAQGVMLGAGALLLVSAAVNLLSGAIAGVIQAVIGLALVWYLIFNLKRLSAQAGSTAEGE